MWPRRVAVALLLLVGAVLFLSIVGLFPLLSARSNLQGARQEMLTARESLLSREAGAAAKAFRRAEGLFLRAQDDLGNPVLRIAGWLPVLGRTPDALTAMADSGELLASAGRLVAEAAGSVEGGLTAFVPRKGAIPIEPIREMTGPLQEAQALVHQAVQRIEDTPETLLVGPVSSARQEFDEVLDEAARAVDVSAILTRVLPSFLGEDERRRYFFAAQNPAELRGTGGFLGAFTILTISEGEVRLGEFTTIQRLPSVDPSDIEPPNPSYAVRYDRFGGAGFWHNINMTPDFPSAAEAIERLYRETTGVRLDGTIVADPFALAALLGVTGPVNVPGTDDTVTAANVVDYVTNEAYGDVPESVRKRILGDVAREAWSRFFQGPAEGGPRPLPPGVGPPAGREGRDRQLPSVGAGRDRQVPSVGTGGRTPPPGTREPPSRSGVGTPSPDERPELPGGERRGEGRGADLYVRAFTSFQQTVAEGHVLFHAADPDIQGAFEEVGIAGSMAGGRFDYLAVIGNNAAANKVDYFADRSVDYRVSLGAEGTAVAHTTIALHNTAPTKGPRYVLGPHDPRFERSENVTFLSTYCARTCVLEDFRRGGRPAPVDSQIELGYPVYATRLEVPSGETERVSYEWRVDRAWDGNSAEGTYRLTFIGQPTVRPTDLTIDVRVPDGMHVTSTSPGMEIAGGRATWSGAAIDRMVFEVRFERPPLAKAWRSVLDFLGRPVIRLG